MYAKTFFEEYDVDALTVAPYMGEDSVTPFLGYDDKWVILLALTSNKGSYDFQLTEDAQGERLFEKVLKKSQQWGNDENMMPARPRCWCTRRQFARGLPIWYDERLRTARQLLTWHHLCQQRRGFCRSCSPKGKGTSRANGRRNQEKNVRRDFLTVKVSHSASHEGCAFVFLRHRHWAWPNYNAKD